MLCLQKFRTIQLTTRFTCIKIMHMKLEYILVHIMIWFGEQWISGSWGNIIVTLKPNNQIYVNNGGTLYLTCDVNQNTGFSSLMFRIESISKVIITNIDSCSSINSDADVSSRYNVTCTGQKTFTMEKYGISSSDHNKRWNCLLNSANASEGPCRGGILNPCVSANVTVIIIVPVTTVQLTNDSGQVLHSSVNIVRGESTGIICTTAPSGSRPRALLQWYYRQGNQSPVLIVDQSVSTTPDPITVTGQSDILISYSTWRLTGNASHHNMYIYCQAKDETNTGNYAKSNETQLNIVYPPAVQLSTYQSANNVKEGLQDFVFICNITESNPMPQADSYSWFHKNSSIQEQTSSSYTLKNVQKSDAGEYMCTARNYYGEGKSQSLDLIVQYPPKITVIITGSTQQNQTAVLICGAVGVPADTTFFPWIQRWRDVVIRTGLLGTTNSTHSVLTLNRLSLESMGTYICTANNGIMGTSGTLNQNGSENLQFKGKAIVLDDDDKFVGEIGLSVNVSIPFYSDPVIMKFVIQTENREVMNTSQTMTYLSKEIVTYQFYNIAIQLDAQKANFVIQNVTPLDFDNYTLVLTNSFGNTSFKFCLDPFGHPRKVERFYFHRFIDDQIQLHFVPGFNGGPEQTFVIEYLSESNLDNVWKNSSVTALRETESQYKLPNGTFFVNVIKPSPGSYIYRMYSWNVKGRSPVSDNITVTVGVMDNAPNKNPTVEAVAGGVGAGIFVIAVIIFVVILLRRGTCLKKKSTALEREMDSTDRNHRKSKLTDNPVYDASNSRSGTGIVVVTHAEDPSKVYAQVVKTKTKKEKAMMAKSKQQNITVQNLIRVEKKHDAAAKKHGKTSRAASEGKHRKTSRGDIYENATQALKSSAENVYENPGQLATGPSSGDNVYETHEPSVSKGQVSKDGLVYADVVLGPPSTNGRKPIIHGLEDRTVYADIDYEKRGKPLPESDEEKESSEAKKTSGTKSSTDE